MRAAVFALGVCFAVAALRGRADDTSELEGARNVGRERSSKTAETVNVAPGHIPS